MLRSHELHKKPIDLHSVIHESLALVVHELRARQIEVTLDLSSTPCVIDGDQVLLEQVLVNLIRNAIDALAETPPARRHITIRSVVTTADVEVSVCDTGTGLSAEIDRHAVHPFRYDKTAWPRDRPGDRTEDRRRSWRDHRCRRTMRDGRCITVTLPVALRSSSRERLTMSPVDFACSLWTTTPDS